MTETEALRSLILPLLIAISASIAGVFNWLNKRLATRNTELEAALKKYHDESDSHQKTRNELTVSDTKLKIVNEAKDRLEAREETYQEQIGKLHQDIGDYRHAFEERMSQLRLDFDAEINALKEKHREFVLNRDEEIKAKTKQILSLEAEVTKRENQHLIDLKEQEVIHKLALDERDRTISKQLDSLNSYRRRLEIAEDEIKNLSTQMENLLAKVDTQTLKPVKVTLVDEGEIQQ